MPKNALTILACLLAAAFAVGCKPKPGTGPIASPVNARAPFQNESQFIVETIVSDLAEQMFYAANNRLPDPQYFSIAATEKPGSPLDAPVYELRIGVGPKQSDLKLDLSVNGSIWSPTVYQAVASEIAGAVGLKAGTTTRADDTALLSKLGDGTAGTIERENQELSAALEKDFCNPVLHEKAALLLGAFLLRDHSGHFFEIRSPLSRMTAHLAMARFLSGTNISGIQGQMAEAMLMTLAGDEAPALKMLSTVGTNDATVVPVVRALWTRNTGDYRTLDQADNLSPIESVERFAALADYVATPIAWSKLNGQQQQTIDFVRAANQENYSVEIGHQLLRVSLPLEFKEIQDVYKLWHHRQLPRASLVKSLNEMPERCFSRQPNGEVHVRIIGWGQWADFLQRHLCHAIQQNFYFMDRKWAVHEDAREFAAGCERQFRGLRLYPFVRRFNCTDVESYHRSVDDGLKVTTTTPQLVPAQCWNYLWFRVSFAPWYHPTPNLRLNEWHNRNPLPGTVYDLNARLSQPSLIDRPDVVAHFERLHELAPYDCRVANFLLAKKYTNRPTYDQAMALYSPLLPYSVYALRTVASTVWDQPKRYEKLMLQAADLNPANYYNLGNYALRHTNEDRAAYYYDKAAETDPDSIRVANNAEWRVRYYLKKGLTDKAREIADFAGEVYSDNGLEAKAIYFEATTNYDAAYMWFAKIEDRYNNPVPLLNFCTRYRLQTGDRRFEPEVQKRLQKLFPAGIENVTLKDFHNPPPDGVVIKGQNDLLLAAGLKAGDVVVAVYGVRVHNYRQYAYGVELKNTPELELIVWQGDAYREYKPSPPNHRFGVTFATYPPKWSGETTK